MFVRLKNIRKVSDHGRTAYIEKRENGVYVTYESLAHAILGCASPSLEFRYTQKEKLRAYVCGVLGNFY